MTPSAGYDWTAARGDKWRQHLDGVEAMLDPVDAPLLEALDLDAAHRVADIGCGGGGTTLKLRHRLPVGGVVHGFDISPTLVEVARTRSGSDGPRFEVADVGSVALPVSPYDRLVSRFGVMFFAEPPTAFGRLRQWLAPGGRFGFAVWGPPVDNPWVAVVREVVGEFVELPPPEPDAPGPFRYADPDRFRTLLEQAGFSNVELKVWRGELPVGSGLQVDEAARFALASFSSFSEALARAGDTAFEEARRSLAQRLAPHWREGTVWMNARVHLFTGGGA